MQLQSDLQEHIIFYFSRFYRKDLPQLLKELLISHVEKNIHVGFRSLFIDNVTPLLELCELLEYLSKHAATGGLIDPAMRENGNVKAQKVLRRYKPICEL